jgi:hypothetical protein
VHRLRLKNDRDPSESGQRHRHLRRHIESFARLHTPDLIRKIAQHSSAAPRRDP